MAFMKPKRKGVGVAMLIGAERGNIITYAISNKTGRFVKFNLATLNKKVTTGWPSVRNLKTKRNSKKRNKAQRKRGTNVLNNKYVTKTTTINQPAQRKQQSTIRFEYNQ